MRRGQAACRVFSKGRLAGQFFPKTDRGRNFLLHKKCKYVGYDRTEAAFLRFFPEARESRGIGFGKVCKNSGANTVVKAGAKAGKQERDVRLSAGWETPEPAERERRKMVETGTE